MGDSNYKPKVIDKFEGEFAFLSNFYPSSIGFFHPAMGFECHGWTVEHAFQSLKTHDKDEILEILKAETPGQAKRLGRKATIIPTWDEVKAINMGILVRLKFKQHPDLREKLLATGSATLIEGNNWGDTYWGEVDGEGMNMLGKILMCCRLEEMQNG